MAPLPCAAPTARLDFVAHSRVVTTNMVVCYGRGYQINFYSNCHKANEPIKSIVKKPHSSSFPAWLIAAMEEATLMQPWKQNAGAEADDRNFSQLHSTMFTGWGVEEANNHEENKKNRFQVTAYCSIRTVYRPQPIYGYLGGLFNTPTVEITSFSASVSAVVDRSSPSSTVLFKLELPNWSPHPSQDHGVSLVTLPKDSGAKLG
jgi:hypothetical protein